MVGSPIEGLQLITTGTEAVKQGLSKWWEARLRDCNILEDYKRLKKEESKWWEARLRDCNIVLFDRLFFCGDAVAV